MNLLSIDGGGIRGIIPGQVLVALEQQLQQLSGNPGKRLADVFDMMAGTSTGGILTCLYLAPDPATRRPKYSASEAVDLYLQNGDTIFDVSVFRSIMSAGGMAEAKYSAAPLEKVLLTYFGELQLGQLLRPCLIPGYDITRRGAKFFNSADVTVGEDGASRNFYVRDVARATSAAPTYFEPANVWAMDRQVYPLIDGGMFANNPTMCACVEAFGYNDKLGVGDLKVLSLGTGAADKAYHYSEAKNWGKISWAIPVLEILMSGAAETVDYQMQTLFHSAGCPNQYLRLQVNLADLPGVDGAMDNASEANMSALQTAGAKLAKDSEERLGGFARMLLGME